jgi:DNA repair protein RadC
MKEYKTKLNKISLLKEPTVIQNIKIGNADDTADYARQFYGDDISIYESFFTLFLNNSCKTIGYSKISQGGITGTMVDIRLVAKYALECMATQVILVHNHPSGSLKASKADIDITKKIKDALNLLDIRVIDHLILTEESYYSFASENLI